MCQEVRRLSGEIKCAARCFGGKRTGTSGRGRTGTIRYNKGFRHGETSREAIDYDVTCRLMNEIRDTAEQGSVFSTAAFRSYTSLKFLVNSVRSIITHSASRDVVIVTALRGSGHVHKKDAYSTMVSAKIIAWYTAQ